MGFIQKAEETLFEAKKVSSATGEDIHSCNDNHSTDRVPRAEVPLVEAELTRLRALDRERQKVADQRLRGTVLVSWLIF